MHKSYRHCLCEMVVIPCRTGVVRTFNPTVVE